MVNNEEIKINGLLAELGYLKLEDSRFQGDYNNDNIKSFLNNVQLKNGETKVTPQRMNLHF